MPVSAETLRLLMEAGVEGDDLLRVVASIDADNQPRARTANAERQARFRERKRAESVTSNVTNNVTENVTPRVRVEDNLQTTEISGQSQKKKTAREELADFQSELSSVLDAERVQALVDVRRKKGGKLNGHSARLLIAKIRDSGLSAADAADTMVLRNWISIERSWVERNHQTPSAKQQSTAPPKAGVVGMAHRIIESENNGSEGIFGDNRHVEFLPAAGGDGQRNPPQNLLGSPQGRVFAGRH